MRAIILTALTFTLPLTSCASAQDGMPTSSIPLSEPYVQPDPEEAALAFVACVEDRGFTTERLPDGGVQVKSTPDQLEAFRSAMEDCRRWSMGLSDAIPEPTTAQVEQYFDGLVRLATCLEGRGYNITETPSLEAFVEEGVGSWDPLGEVLAHYDVSPAELTELTDVCPQPQLYSSTDSLQPKALR